MFKIYDDKVYFVPKPLTSTKLSKSSYLRMTVAPLWIHTKSVWTCAVLSESYSMMAIQS